METKLARITEVAKMRPNEKFTSLYHYINEEMLLLCHTEMSGNKATGVDEVTKEEYETKLSENIKDLVNRLKSHSYRPMPVLRVYIDKAGTNKKRPLGIPAYEDKLVQKALAKILNAVYEADFLDCSFGFRPNRGCHDALKILNHYIERDQINYIVDADIRSYFDNVDHQWLMKFLKHRITDPNIHRLISRLLKSGVVEAGIKYDTPIGAPQGGVASPILSNIYLHYVLDLWFEKVVRRNCRGQAYMVRYADDFVCCFQYEQEAKMFYQSLIERLAKFKLEIAEDKTRIINFGRYAAQLCHLEGRRKPDTFDFLGFTHYCSKSQKGKFRVKRKTSRKKYKASLLKVDDWIKVNRHLPVKELMGKLGRKIEGYYNYYAVTDNRIMVDRFYNKVKRFVFKWLNRRSQRRSFNWEKYQLTYSMYPLPRAKIRVNIYNLRHHISYIL
ncbi:Group II intron-encoded protein LtrA [Sporotomaculum syntrophicum]|uniref:Group II intron-encoded protein LtrA n=1 Tax=Sporotomaculum syntrophicum TaxID=182264 RepID=A0A9D2WQL7_9FIRM|nr:group II intron reverse transcriptase/maturase [Sporotomaculum syntrophicum]KAF1085126.1 Group II intron-encoded protein LtrA [Sporotomaculum syntrophicum]